ncbi:MAG: dihydroorotase family protein, partial [Promethearchaeota archaeon]
MSVHDLKIVNGHVVLPTHIEKADILVDNGNITAIIKSGIAKQKNADNVINASGCVILPGLVDVHVHFRDPGYPQKEDFASGSAAAAAGGVTTIADMPNTKPPTTTPKHLAEKIQFGEAKSRIDFALHGGPPIRFDTDNDTNAINFDFAQRMQKSGILSFKIYMPHNEAPYIPPLSSLGLPLTIHAEAPALLSTPIDGSHESFFASRPADAEVLAIEHLLQKPLGVPLHICHLSTNQGLQHILAAQKRGFRVTCEVTPHHLLLSKKKLAHLGPISKCFPPLRSTSDVQTEAEKCQLLNCVKHGSVFLAPV